MLLFLCFVCLRPVYPMLQCLWIVHSRFPLRFSLTFIFVLCLVYPVLPVSLDCPFLIAPSISLTFIFVLCLVYPALPVSLDCPFLIVPSVSLTFIFVLCLVYPALPVSLDCPFLIAPSVFSNVYFRPVSCVPGVTSVSGLSLRFP